MKLDRFILASLLVFSTRAALAMDVLTGHVVDGAENDQSSCTVTLQNRDEASAVTANDGTFSLISSAEERTPHGETATRPRGHEPTAQAALAGSVAESVDTLLLRCNDWPTKRVPIRSYSGTAGTIRVNPPNIIFVISDDQAWSQIGVPMDPDVPGSYSRYVETPALNRLAKEGLRFASAYAPQTTCTPSRRSILLGTTAARSGTYFKSSYVPSEHLTIPHALKQAYPHYVTANFGKWGAAMGSTPEQCGYDISDGPTTNSVGGFGAGVGDDAYVIVEDPKRTSSVTGRAKQFMQTQAAASKPFYMQVGYYAPHIRIELTQETLDKYVAKGLADEAMPPAYAGMLEELDAGIMELLTAIRDLGLADNTYLFFMSDNGGLPSLPGVTSRAGRQSPNHPLRDGKRSLYEGGIRVPFIVRGPGIPPGTVSDVPVAGYDLLPTFYELAGGKKKLPDSIDGVSLKAILENPEGSTFTRPLGALIFHRPASRRSAIREGKYKLLVTWNAKQPGRETRELYDLSRDIREATNIVSSQQEVADALEKKLLDYLGSVSAEPPPGQPR